MPASEPAATQEAGFFETIFESSAPLQEVVVMNTKKGFVPATVRLRQGMNYKFHVVNINEEERNVSFVMDAFSEHHATYFGNIKTFILSPKKEGVFSFQCPETSAQGKLVVYPSYNMDDSMELRQPASR
ncbi:MAG: cupredoxin domain-containing protein [Bdellovibrionales bacterium]